VELSVTEQGVAEVTTTAHYERIIPVQDADADLFRKTSKVVTRVIQVRPSSICSLCSALRENHDKKSAAATEKQR